MTVQTRVTKLHMKKTLTHASVIRGQGRLICLTERNFFDHFQILFMSFSNLKRQNLTSFTNNAPYWQSSINKKEVQTTSIFNLSNRLQGAQKFHYTFQIDHSYNATATSSEMRSCAVTIWLQWKNKLLQNFKNIQISRF